MTDIHKIKRALDAAGYDSDPTIELMRDYSTLIKKGALSMIKRLTILALVFSSFLLLNHYSPISEASSAIHKTTQMVSKVSYSEADNTYYLYTSPSSHNASKSVWIVPFNAIQGESLEQFKARVIGHAIDIYYWIDEAADGDKEIFRTVVR